METQQDRYFERPMEVIRPFTFDQGVADCFDDMVSRSVPYYGEVHRILCDLLPYQVRAGDCIYDLGCSTGTTLQMLSRQLQGMPVHFIGLDQSAPMIVKAREKCVFCVHPVELLCEDLLAHQFRESGVVVMNYTLQFIPQEERAKLLERICHSLRPGGLLVLSEKIKSQDGKVQQLQTDLYCDFKRKNGYSELEIAQKRQALENVLVPLTARDQMELLSASGFTHVDMIFRWFNFACFIGIKEHGP